MNELAHGVFFFQELNYLNWNTDTLRPSPELFNLLVDKYNYKSFSIRIYEHLGPEINFRRDTKGDYPLEFTYNGARK